MGHPNNILHWLTLSSYQCSMLAFAFQATPLESLQSLQQMQQLQPLQPLQQLSPLPPKSPPSPPSQARHSRNSSSSFRPFLASLPTARSSDADTKDTYDTAGLAPHYTSESTLQWLNKMCHSYQLERGESLQEVLLREGSMESGDASLSDVSAIAEVAEVATIEEVATLIAQSPLPIASHDFLRDPTGDAIYNYGNLAFLNGFGYEWEEFVHLPSRKCVETEGEVEERQALLDAVKAKGVTAGNSRNNGKDGNSGNSVGDSNDNDGNHDLESNYDNLIRIRKDRRRILLTGVNLWNVYDIDSEEEIETARSLIEKGEMKAVGQAVWIKHVEYLDVK